MKHNNTHAHREKESALLIGMLAETKPTDLCLARARQPCRELRWNERDARYGISLGT